MSYCVCKFGGSNLKSSLDISKVIKAVKSYSGSLVVVVSAFYGVTDNLCSITNCKESDTMLSECYLHELKKLKFAVAQDHITDSSLFMEFESRIEARFRKLEYLITGARYIGETPPFLFDEIASYGERFSSLLLTYLLRQVGVQAQEALPEDIGLLTDGVYGNATIRIEECAHQVSEYFSEPGVYIVPGFYGISDNHKTTLLGRGGSDYTASALAACLQAKCVDLWKDVAGFCSADPNSIDNVEAIPELSYAEAAELAYFGSKILHPRTVEPLESGEIPLHIRHIHGDLTIYETRIGKLPGREFAGIKSITSSDDIALIELQGEGVGMKPGVLAKATKALDELGLNIKSVYTSQTSIHLMVERSGMEPAYAALIGLNWTSVTHIVKRQNISLIAAVGEGLADTYGIAGMLFEAAAKACVNIQSIVFGASKVAVYFIVNKTDKDAIVQQVHDTFFVPA